MQARPPASPTRFWGHPLFAMLIGLAVITFKNVFGAQLYDWYLASANPQLASAGTATATAAASDLIEVHFTAPTSGIADSLATGLVESGLVACAQVVPEVRSVYTWGGKLNHESEELVIAKTLRHHFEAVEKVRREGDALRVWLDWLICSLLLGSLIAFSDSSSCLWGA